MMSVIRLATLALVYSVVSVVSKEEEEAVITLTEDKFDKFLEDNPVSLVEFYAPWCGHCKQLAPEFEKAAQTLKEKKIPLAKVDATIETKLATRFNIRGFPTLKIFRNGEAEEYRGGRTHDSIVAYVEQVTGPAVEVAKTKDELEKFMKDQAIVYIGHFEKEEGDEYDIFVKTADAHRTKGKFITFVTKDKKNEVHVHRKDEDAVSHAIKDVEALKDFVLTEFFPLFGPISGENFADYTARDLEMVWYCGTPKDFDDVGKAVRDVAKQFREKYSFVWLDSEQYGSHAEGALGVSDFPATVLQAKAGRYIFPHKEVKSDLLKSFFDDVHAGKIEKSLKSEEIPEKNDDPVKVVVGKSFENVVFQKDKDVMLEVYAPWCGHCKKLEPIYDEFAKLLETSGVKDVVIAKMDGTTNESPSSDFEWTGFPTIFFVKAGEKEPLRYDGARTLEGLTEFIKKKASNPAGIVIKEAEPKKEAKEEVKEEL